MGDRYSIDIKCANCGTENEHWHAESSGSMSFTCKKCEKINWVFMLFMSRIVTPEQEKKRYEDDGFV